MITSPSNPTLKLIRALQSQRKAREKERLFVIEGVRLVEEAIRTKAAVRLALHTEDLDPRGCAALNQLARLGAELHEVTPKVLAAASDTQTPQGLLAVVPFPHFATRSGHLSFVIILDRLSDPGNLGTILRTADAAGVDAAFLAPGTVDAYNPKVVRAAMGAHFHLPMTHIEWDELRVPLSGLTVWLAEAHNGEPYSHVDWRQPSALIVGSEAEGPSDAARRFTPQRVHIPMPGLAESLNAAVAAGVLLFEAARQRRS
jgi:RNA methyltransferase, TrmH family